MFRLCLVCTKDQPHAIAVWFVQGQGSSENCQTVELELFAVLDIIAESKVIV